MKKQLFVILLTIFSISAISQTNTLLTKEETINYINKKVQEAIGHERKRSEGNFIIAECSFRKSSSGDNVEHIYKQEPHPRNYIEFNPAHIKEVKEVTGFNNEKWER